MRTTRLPSTIDPPYRPAMDRRRFLMTSIAGVIAAPLAQAQPPGGGVARVGYLSAGSPFIDSPDLNAAFVEGLREQGYVEGKNLVIVSRFAAQRYERLPKLAAELVRDGVHVIFAPGDRPAEGARQATQTVPIVFTGAGDPVASHFVVSLSRPGGNMTGLTQSGTQVVGKRLSLLKEAFPKLSWVAVLSNPMAFTHQLAAGYEFAPTLGLKLRVFEASSPREFETVFAAMAKERLQAVLLLGDSIFYQAREQLASVALRRRLAMIGWRPIFARAGAFMAYGAEITADHRRGAILVGKILNGAKPSDIPVEEPAQLELVINLKTAKALGLTIPPSLLARADQVIE
jgi:putative tryptophan/tyrosine transport system substrate-binding protein